MRFPSYILHPASCISPTDWLYSPVYRNTCLAYPTPSSILDFRDLELLHHYATRTSLTLAAKETLPIWQVDIPGEAKTHLFLMHSLLALSALHLSYVWPEKRDQYVHVANQQHEHALSSFRSSVRAITSDNGSAVTAFSFLTVVFSAGLPIVFGFSGTPNPTSTFIDILQVLRRAWSAVDNVLPGIENGALGPLIKQAPNSGKSCSMHVRGREVLDFLQRYNETSPDCEEHKAIYQEALTSLTTFFTNIPNTPPLWGNSLIWPTSVSDEFFQLLQEKKSFPLILLAHWCVPVFRSPSLWFNAWAKNIVADIWKMLDGESRNAVIWPAEQVGFIPRELHSNMCLCLDCRPDAVPGTYCKESAAVLEVGIV